MLGDLHYSRQAEEEADSEGMKMVLAARIDPQGMIDFFDVLSEQEGIRADSLKYLSTHPIASDRIARLKGLASGWPGTPARLLPGKDWTKLAKLC